MIVRTDTPGVNRGHALDRPVANRRTPREAWVEQGLRALADGGPEGVRIEVLARELGVTKGGFYWHFDDRDALLDEVLATWERHAVDDAIEHVEGGAGDARAKLRRLFVAAGTANPRAELSIREWAKRDRAVARRLKRVDDRRMTYMRTLFTEICTDAGDVEARCLLAMALFIANPFIDVDHGTRTRSEVITAATDHLLR